MALPPERISIKRRRQDEPVDTLVLEHGSAHDKKRQFTDFFFQRLRNDRAHSTVSVSRASKPAAAAVESSRRDYQAFGIPTVKTSAPGDEVKDFKQYRTMQGEIQARTQDSEVSAQAPQFSSPLGNDNATSVPSRRFHLARDISSLLKANPSAGTRRMDTSLRPPLATFIERHDSRLLNSHQSVYNWPPIDSIVHLKDTGTASDKTSRDEDSIANKTQIDTFFKTPVTDTKSGMSIHDDPTTWDQDSDQLANELAALAFDMDPGDAVEPPQAIPTAEPAVIDTPSRPAAEPMLVDNDDEFVFETYVRVKHDSKVDFSSVYHNAEVGVLVIDDENEDLWERYVRDDDDDDEWDEEDGDSNAEDNPRNEYPDDDVSTDDEYGRSSYKHRKNASDDEDYDETRQEW